MRLENGSPREACSCGQGRASPEAAVAGWGQVTSTGASFRPAGSKCRLCFS